MSYIVYIEAPGRESTKTLSATMIEILNHVTVDNNGCWLLDISGPGNPNYELYGGISYKGERGTHRVVWLAYYGHIPEGMLVCHTCDRPSCCNPKHLFLSTHKGNTADAISKGRWGHQTRKWWPVKHKQNYTVPQDKSWRRF